MNSHERVIAVLNGDTPDRIPVSTWGHDFLREWSAEDLADHTIERQEKFGYDFVKLNPRWTIFAEAWGNRYEPPTEQVFPRLTHKVINGPEDFDRIEYLETPAPAFVEYESAMKQVADALDVDVIATVFSPLAVTGLLCGGLGQPLISYADEAPEALRTCLDNVTRTLIDHSRRLLEAGAAGLFYAPLQWTSTDVCSPEFYARFGTPWDLELLNAVQDAPFNMLHVCGNNIQLERFEGYPVHVLNWDNFGEGNPTLADVHNRTDKVVSGGLPHRRLHKLSHDEISETARDACEGLHDRLMLTGGCAVGAMLDDGCRAHMATIPQQF